VRPLIIAGASIAIVVVLFALGSCTRHDPNDEFRHIAADYIARYLETHPVRATGLGVHDHDGRLPDRSAAAIERRTEELAAWLSRLEALDRDLLSGDEALDIVILDHAIRAERLELEEVRGWRHDPMSYNRSIAGGVASLIEREFAPLAERLESGIRRLEQIPTLLETARDNLDRVPPEWIDLAIAGIRGTAGFLREDVPVALEEQGGADLDAALVARWNLALASAVPHLEEFAGWLDRDLRPRANGDFRLGAHLFERKLLYEEHLAVSVEELQQLNERAIVEYRSWVAREAARIDGSLSPAEVMRKITETHPGADELLDQARSYVEQARDFIVKNEIVTLPTDRLPIVRATPRYERSGFASMSTPGPFESVATESYYNITNVDPTWSYKQQDEHLTYFNYPGLLGVSIHEAMPGHFVQLLHRQRIASDVRKIFSPASFVEGWAHYCEQMMIDEGLGDGDPAVRLGQLRRALQRHARWAAGLDMHAFGATVDDAARRFQEIAYFAPFPARRETLRGTYNPTYLYYALGRMKILELREDYKGYLTSRGESFSLSEFHDRLLELGLPIPLARQVLIPG